MPLLPVAVRPLIGWLQRNVLFARFGPHRPFRTPQLQTDHPRWRILIGESLQLLDFPWRPVLAAIAVILCHSLLTPFK